uniref:Uncharacterized protein n=1 Tax=Globisporangium ultimum (strain ATCC 200006 / CBS 805.95 / DAOM BR144) TaxID=431595 RepID=K3XD30_GLOUD
MFPIKQLLKLSLLFSETEMGLPLGYLSKDMFKMIKV